MSLVLDTHLHFWQRSRFDYSWIPRGDEVLDRDYLPTELAGLMNVAGVHRAIHVQAAGDPREAAWLLELADIHPWIVGVVGWCDPADSRLPAWLDPLRGDRRFVGVRPSVLTGDGAVRPDAVEGLRYLQRHSLRLDLLVGPTQLAGVAALAGQFPELKMVINHLANPRIGAAWDGRWADGLRAAAEAPNVFCKLSGMPELADSRRWTIDDLRPFARHAIECFGPSRVMFGTNWPVCRRAAEHRRVTDTTRQLIADLTADERDQIMGLTGARFYRLASAGGIDTICAP